MCSNIPIDNLHRLRDNINTALRDANCWAKNPYGSTPWMAYAKCYDDIGADSSLRFVTDNSRRVAEEIMVIASEVLGE